MIDKTLVTGIGASMVVLAVSSTVYRLPSTVLSCPAISAWSAVPDSAWPLITHRDGDDAWAHLEPAHLPGDAAGWCNPLQDDSAATRAGRATFQSYCATCHGDLGAGDGPGAAVADPRPYNFTNPEFAGLREPPGPAVLYAIVTRGIGETNMNAFAQFLSPRERLQVLAYIATLPGPSAVARSRAWADTLRARRPGS
jgi:mono/diheme cytochrome c family protein